MSIPSRFQGRSGGRPSTPRFNSERNFALQQRIRMLQMEEKICQHRLDIPERNNVGNIRLFPAYPACPPLTGLRSPTSLTHICRNWREIALANPKLWRALSTFYNEFHEADSGRTDLAEKLAARGEPNEAFGAILLHRERWRHVDLELAAEEVALIKGPMPLLEILSLVVDDWDYTHPATTFGDFPRLRAVTLDYARHGSWLPISQLTSLTFEDVEQAKYYLPLLQDADNLVRLNLIDCDTDVPLQSNIIRLDRLEMLVIVHSYLTGTASALFETFTLPTLHTLHISGKILGPDPNGSLNLLVAHSGSFESLGSSEETGEADANRTPLYTDLPSTRLRLVTRMVHLTSKHFKALLRKIVPFKRKSTSTSPNFVPQPPSDSSLLERDAVQQAPTEYKYPILSLPSEITSEIFLQFLPSYPERTSCIGPSSPALLLQVCCEWRDVALATPELWSTFEVKMGHGGPPAVHARDQRLLVEWLERSKDCPLSVELFCTDGPPNALAAATLIDTLVRHSKRLFPHSLRFVFEPAIWGNDGAKLSLPRNFTLQTPNLRKLHLDHPGDDFDPFKSIFPWSQITVFGGYLAEHDAAQVLRSAKVLEECSMTLVAVDRRRDMPWGNLAPIPPLHHLKSLALKSNWDAPGSVGLAKALVKALPALEILDVQERLLSAEDPVGALSLLCPAGYTGRLKIRGARTAAAMYEAAFPNVEELVVENDDDSDAASNLPVALMGRRRVRRVNR
ncbi:hypothetical protein FB45DRAFT_862445 [Roridomyces roridus]|uniref:F-box domain-containing protein n=1 Tax=Roridomyces roridus TaxID=1738132 RepID=A0AAD7C7F9_9AGAR|nr:hypothetical protein FB45DRAFT_862445 [Roridomyces roridus]